MPVIVKTEKILPDLNLVLVTIDCDIVGVSRKTLEEYLMSGQKIGQKRVLERTCINFSKRGN